MGAFAAGMFHLITHAFFKALLFMAAGVIHALAGEEDLNRMGGLWKKLPVMYVGFVVRALALTGFRAVRLLQQRRNYPCRFRK